MKGLLLGLAMLPLLAVPSMAASQLTDQQMDAVRAGFHYFEMDVTNTGTTAVAVNTVFFACVGCYLDVTGTLYPSAPGRGGERSLQVFGFFGPVNPGSVLIPPP